MNSTSRRPKGMVLKRRPVPMFEDGGITETWGKVKEGAADLWGKAKNVYNWRENLAENITPRMYSAPSAGHYSGKELNTPFERLYNAIVLDKKEPNRESFDRFTSRRPADQEREDFFNMMLGRDQVHDSIKESQYRPTIEKDKDATYYTSDVTEETIRWVLRRAPSPTGDVDSAIEQLIGQHGATLGEYKVDKGEDERGSYVSYYDKWDVNPFSDKKYPGSDVISRGAEDAIQSVAGLTPAEIYGRVYYDPETGQPIDDTPTPSKKDGGRIKVNKERPTGMQIKKNPVPRFEDGGVHEPDKTVKGLLKYLSEYGRDFIPDQGLGIDRTPLDVELQGIGRRLSPEESARLDAEESEKHRETSVQGLEEYESKKAHDEKVKAMGRQPIDPNLGYIRETPAPLRGLRTRTQTVAQKKDADAKAGVPDAAFEMARWMPILGEALDTGELAKVATTGKDFYGEERDPLTFGAMMAAGYVIPNALERPLKSAWRAIKKFPGISKRQLNELPGERREQILGNLVTAHDEVYKQSRVTNGILRAEDATDMKNVRQLPSLMSGSKLENAVGKDGMIDASQIKNLISNKNTSKVESALLQEVLDASTITGGKIDYNEFRRHSSAFTSSQFRMDNTRQYADYGLNNLGKKKNATLTEGLHEDAAGYPAMREKYGLKEGSPRTNLIRTTDPDLQSEGYGHFGEDVIGHYRSFERTDEKGVLYISEMQSDPLQSQDFTGASRVPEDKAADEISKAAKSLVHAKKLLADLDNVNKYGELYDWGDGKIYPGVWADDAVMLQHAGLPKGGAKNSPTDKFLREATGQDVHLAWKNLYRFPLTDLAAERKVMGEALERKIARVQAYHDDLAGGWRGGPNAKQASLIKNQDQFLISHILEAESKGAERIRFPTGETTGSIQGYGSIEDATRVAKGEVKNNERYVDDFRNGTSVKRTFNEHPLFKGKTDDEIMDLMDTGIKEKNSIGGQTLRGEVLNKSLIEGFKAMGLDKASARRTAILVDSWYESVKKLRTSREHLTRVNANSQSTTGIMKGYDDLPKALKKHGLTSKKVTDDLGNTWWEVETPAKLGAGVGEIRSFKKGGRFKILKKQL